MSDVDHEAVVFAGGVGRLAGDRWGIGGERGQLVMLHGGAQTRHTWDRAARSLARDGWEVITLDARGHGESDWAPNADYSIDAMVDDLLHVREQLRQWSDRPPVIIGASMGGMTGLVAQGEHGGVARGLVLVDIVPKMEMDGIERIGAFMRSAPDGFDSLEDVADAVAAYQRHRIRPRNIEGLRRNVREAENGRLYWHWDPAFFQDRAVDDEALRYQSRMRAAAVSIDIPTLLVHGALSDIVSADGAADLVDLIPGASTIDVAGAAHMVAGDDNAVFIEHTSAFLRAL